MGTPLEMVEVWAVGRFLGAFGQGYPWKLFCVGHASLESATGATGH